MSNLRSAAAAMMTLTLLTTACGTTARDEPEPAATDTSVPAATPPAPPTGSNEETGKATAPAALRFTAQTLDGKTFQGESLAGKPIAFWFWAPWCTKCLSDAPAVKAAAAQHKDVAFVGIAGLDTEAAMKQFVQRTDTSDLVHLSDPKGAVWTKLGVSQQSTFVFMKPDGSLEKASGPLGQDGLEEHLRTLTAQQTP
ncbi:redoxin domain-containing protein [Nonomuraea sp. LP-02]|uniref:redoxin domain-containing protein n=1 Tax=Nonomuraea sp. LP-02 TaxID=3097960 RepID=UPI002E340134|nr:redoxin domain-containing protein [Nonomuraea sp. LP-02]MED7924246.1 redoxin domain-containing protein [Nonomuraea sp. LP-02]